MFCIFERFLYFFKGSRFSVADLISLSEHVMKDVFSDWLPAAFWIKFKYSSVICEIHS